ncbi:Phage-related minor tail protein [Variovorax sp. HW608]|uniref:phage tail tape measure C-terminal domain-containing protein n=1 Tax=Variovorax sp. HW608 TaxID=1034889 RepID=UPI00081FCCF5|nr:phage tail tape measure C-terminal domain-containing protein [Variovorax sp. HW608]SCK48995.1 Phage-related minor tail protein [Variovorax sp. HW608]
MATTDNIERIVRYEADTSQAIAQLDKLTAATQRNAEQMDNVGGQLASIGTKLDIAAGFYIAKEVIGQVTDAVKGMIDQMDQLGKSAQQVGLTVEQVQELQYAFGFAGLKGSETVTVLGRLTDKLADIDDMTNKSSRGLRSMGIAAGDDASTAILKMADAFQGMSDGTEKTSIAVDTFGRTLGMKMIPALNDGSAAVEQLIAEQSQYGQVSEETARQASEFNDKLTRLEEVGISVGKAIVAELLPGLNKFLDWCLSMVSPVSRAISWLNELNASFSAGAIAAKAFSVASAQLGPPPGLKSMADSVGTFADSLQKAAEQEAGPRWLKKFEEQARDTAEGFAQVPQKVKALREAISFLDPAVEKDALLLKSYTKQLESLEKQLDGTTKKAGTSRRTPTAIQTSDFEKWMDSMLKFATASDDAGAKIEWLTSHLAVLAANGDTISEAFKRWTAELRRLQPDPVADALERIARAAKALDDQPAIIAGLSERMTELMAAGKGGTEEFRLLREEILKLEAAKDPIAAVTLELEKMRAETRRNAEMEAEWFRLLADGAVTTQEFAEGASKHMQTYQDGMEKSVKQTKDLADAIEEAGARFVTDFVGTLIDGFGKTDQAFSDMIESMLKNLAKLLVNQQIANLFRTMGWGSVSGTAQGGAWDASGVEFMARGGILSRPTFFATGGGLAVAGEAGAEAVVPLRRGTSGDLGVAASPVTVNIHNNAAVDVSTQNKDNADGSRQIEVYVEQKVKTMFANGSMDRTMRQGYGLTRQPIAG